MNATTIAKMDPFDILFSKNKPFQPIKISGGSTNGRISNLSAPRVPNRLLASDKETWESEIESTRGQLEQQMKLAKSAEGTFVASEVDEHDENDIYKKYSFDRRSKEATQLPVYGMKEKILKVIEESASVVIEGSTGCGKSTQVSRIHFDENLLSEGNLIKRTTFSMVISAHRSIFHCHFRFRK